MEHRARTIRSFPARQSGLILVSCLTCWMMLGCSSSRFGAVSSNHTLSGDNLLKECIAAHRALKTLHAKGTLCDYRHGETREDPIEWRFSFPGRCKIQVGMNTTIISGDHWYTYDPHVARYRSHAKFTDTPIETAAYLLSGGVPFLLPVIHTRGDAAFFKTGTTDLSDWTLEGVTWYANHPCYVILKEDWGSQRESELRILIDQDLMLIRGWTLDVLRRDGSTRRVLSCSYEELTPNADFPSDQFQLNPPEPINPPRIPPPPTSDTAPGLSRKP